MASTLLKTVSTREEDPNNLNQKTGLLRYSSGPERVRDSVRMNVYPCRSRISRELEQCTSVERLETLLSFCSGCIYRIFEEARGMNTMTCSRATDAALMNRIGQLADNEELLDLCRMHVVSA